MESLGAQDPIGSLRTIRGLMKPDGCILWGEPKGSVNPLENRSVMGCFRAGMSVAHCLTVCIQPRSPPFLLVQILP